MICMRSTNRLIPTNCASVIEMVWGWDKDVKISKEL